MMDIGTEIGHRCKALYDEAKVHGRASRDARRRLGDELLLARKVIPHGAWDHWLDRWGINRNTAKRAIREARGLSHRSDVVEQNPESLGPVERFGPNANRNEGGDIGYQAEIEIEEGLEEFMGLDEEEDEDTEPQGHRATFPQGHISTGPQQSGVTSALMTVPRVAGEYAAPVQLTLDAVYEAAQADLSRVERGMRGLLELVKVGDRAAAAKMRAVRMMIDAPILDDCSLSPPPTAAR